MKNHVNVAAYFALCCGAMSLSLGLSEVLLLRAMDQGLPAAGLLAAGVAGYASGQSYARRIGQVPAGLALVGHVAVMGAVLFGLTVLTPMVTGALFGPTAPQTTLQRLPANLVYGLTGATLCITLATFRAGARQWLESREAAGARPA